MRTHGLTPRARIHHVSARGADPVWVLTAPIPATDESSTAAPRRSINAGSAARIVTNALVGLACHIDSVKEESKRANRVVAEVAETIAKGAPGLKVSTKVLEGTPKQLIVEEAGRWQPDLIMLRSHGNGPAERFLLGSVAQSVAVYAPCSVEIVRNRTLAQS